MQQTYDQSAFRIMGQCSQALQLQRQQSLGSSAFVKCDNIQPNKKQIQITIDSGLSPQQQAQNNKIIQKLRGKANKKKQSKQVLIKKTDLGQSQLIFTKFQLEKLKAIDDQQIYGKDYLEDLQNQFTNNLTSGNQGPIKRYFNTPVIGSPTEEIINYLQWVDLKLVKSSKQKKQTKILNFQKKQKSPQTIITNPQQQLKSNLPILKQKFSSPFAGSKLKLNKTKSCYSLKKKNSVENVFLNSLNTNDQFEQKQQLSQKQKLQQITSKVNANIQRQFNDPNNKKKYIYMTEERKQAIFQCEMLRRIKSQLGPKFYQKLQFSYGVQKQQQNNQQKDFTNNKENSDNNNSTSKNTLKQGFYSRVGANSKGCSIKQRMSQQTQAQKMIQKNKNRLKQERLRVIQKMIC